MGELFAPSNSLVSLVLFPLLICCARIMDVSLGTLRIIFVSKGFRLMASVMGFFEVLIWIIVISQVMQNLNNMVNYFAYALGFSLGSFVGMTIERRLSLGMVIIRVISALETEELSNFMRSEGYGVTVLDAEGASGRVNVLLTVIKRTDIARVIGHIKRFNPKSFYTVEDIQTVTEGVFPEAGSARVPWFARLIRSRQGK